MRTGPTVLLVIVVVICVLALVMLVLPGIQNVFEGDVNHLSDEKSQTGGLSISCPGGVVCDENFDYRAFEYRDERVWMYMSFDPGVVNNYNLESFRNNFNYVNFRIQFPEKSSSSVEAYYNTRDPLREIIFTSYENGKLKGEVIVPIKDITLKNRDPQCTYMVDATLPDYCYEEEEVNLELRITFDLTVQAFY